MTARIWKAYSRTGAGKAAEHFSTDTDRRMLFVDRRAWLRERLVIAFLFFAWAAAVGALIATIWSIL